ncbi:hypothetical protein [Persephonella sp.]
MQKMKVSNLIYNLLGNSFSVILTSEESAVQLSDQISFSLRGKNVQLLSVCTEDQLRLRLNIDKKFLDITIDEYLKIKSDGFEEIFFLDNESYALEIEDPELLFKLGMVKTEYISLHNKKDRVYATLDRDNLLKSISEYVLIFKDQT